MHNRNSTFDVMKGIAILAMIIGHSHIPLLMENFLYVWHMPLFFLVSGYFYKQRPEAEFYRRNIRQLLIPYCVTATILITMAALKQHFIGKGDAMITLIAALVGNGCTNNPPFSEYSIGPIWFLLVMFWCRCIYNSLQTKIVAPLAMGGVVFLLSVTATYIGSIFFLPTSILEGVGALLFFYIGHMARIYNMLEWKLSKWLVMATVILVVLSINAGSMSMVRCYYGYWPINYLAAIGMTMLIYRLSYHLKKNRLLAYCGRISLVILCVHVIELRYLLPMDMLHRYFAFPVICNGLFHCCFTVLLSYVILRFRLIQNLFSVK